jgi:hemerythrin-like metal-binding protein
VLKLSETFMLECEELDKDHNRLVEMANGISSLIDSGKCEGCEAKVLEFINFAKNHFGREEQLLAKAGYPDVAKHREHHRTLYEKMDHLVQFAGKAAVNEMARESLKKELVFFVMDDVITTDLDFKAFINESQGA